MAVAELTHPFEPKVGGVKWTVSKEKHTGKVKTINHSCAKAKQDSKLDPHTLEAVGELLEYCSDYLDKLFVHEEVRVYHESEDNKSQIYRASPSYLGRPWYDWAIFDLSEAETPNLQTHVPCRIKCIVDLTSLPMDSQEGIGRAPGLCLIAEPTKPNDDPQEKYRSEFWSAWVTEPSTAVGAASTKSKLEVIPISKLLGPTTVVPDLGNSNKRAHLKLLRPKHWGTLFASWLNDPHERQFDRPQVMEGQEQTLDS